MRTIRLVTYRPLCHNLMGMNAIEKYELQPFIDSSCRREPDFENQFPSITSLCRTNKLAPQLKENDIVIYMTMPGKFKTTEKYLKRGEYKLVAILEVLKNLESHEAGAEWYGDNKVELPSNCMIPNNPPEDFMKTWGLYQSQTKVKTFLSQTEEFQSKQSDRVIKFWNKEYQERADKHPAFNVTKAVYKNLENPPEISRQNLTDWFGKIPMTLSPYKISEGQYQNILNLTK